MIEDSDDRWGGSSYIVHGGGNWVNGKNYA